MAETLGVQAPDDRAVTLYRTDEAYTTAGGTMPTGWHTAVVRAVIERLPVGNRRCQIDWAT